MHHGGIDGNASRFYIICVHNGDAQGVESMSRKDPQFNLRLPEEIKAWVEKNAKENCRSQTAEIVFWLATAKKHQEQAVA